MVDLGPDVVRIRSDQQAVLLDEDEFAEHQVRYGYSADVIRAAEQAAAWLQGAISDGVEPFAAEYRTWLDRVG
jgi:protein associated with RNAse G/E